MKIPLPDALHLLHRAPIATLATQSASLPGYPYATVVPLVLDETQRPLLFISALAEHTKNLLADPRVSLSVVDPDATDVQAGARLTLVGDAVPVTQDAARIARTLRYLPEAANYLGLDFQFFQIEPKRLRYIGGVGRMGWIESTEWQTLPTLDAATETEWIAQAQPAIGETIMGIDPWGIDLRAVQGAQRHRRVAAEPITRLDDVHHLLNVQHSPS